MVVALCRHVEEHDGEQGTIDRAKSAMVMTGAGRGIEQQNSCKLCLSQCGR